MSKTLSSSSKIGIVGAAYLAFAIYLYQPYLANSDKWQYLLIINPCLAAMGCFVLSRRWVGTIAGSFFAGAVYGFGPFMLGFARFHPTAGILAALIPWLFCPAAFFAKENRLASAALAVLPFLAILLFFEVSAHFRLFVMPRQARLHLSDLPGFLAPLVSAKRGMSLIGFYHIPIAALIMGISMMAAARRWGIIVIITLGTALAFCWPIPGLDVSPISWFAIPSVCCAVLVGAGMQGLISSGFADRKWVLAITIVMGALAIATLLLATKYFQTFLFLGTGYARLLVETGKLYVMGAVVVGTIFFMARAKLRVWWLRWVIFCLAMGVDIFLGARFIVDRILF